jgi:D-alanyl-D-alanine carboxypeptidase/D-alanyl-D-alanine-endopeptidase (penicillin-binding protein 4)
MFAGPPLRRAAMLFSLPLLIFAFPAAGQDAESLTRALLRNADLGPTQYTVAARDLTHDEWLIELDADEPMIPASNMKLMTTAAATELLGPGFVFTTELIEVSAEDYHGRDYDPQLDQAGALMIMGSGDPALGDPKLLREHLDIDAEQLLDTWVDAIVETGRQRFAAIVIDDRIFDRQFVHPSWPVDQLNRWYCAEVAGINFHDNCLDVIPRPTRSGLAPEIDLFPEAPFLDTTNRAKTGRDDSFWISRKLDENQFTFHGSVRHQPTQGIPVTVHDPPEFFARLLVHRLAQKGVTVDAVHRPADGAAPLPGRTLHIIRTTLPLVLERTNRNSQNLFAEALLKRMGHQVTGSPGSFENGAAAVRIYLRNTLGPRSAVASVADGSGMSRDNRVTARLLVRLLEHMHRSEHADTFRKSLSFAGKTDDGKHVGLGTLDGRFRDLEPGAWVFGKSGYLRGVSALSGYLVFPDPDQPDQHRVIAFSILFNGFKPPLSNRTLKDLQDAVVDRIESVQRKPTPAAAPTP